MISEQFVHSISLKREKVDSFKAYPFCLPFVEGLDNLELHPKVTFLLVKMAQVNQHYWNQ